MQSEDDKQDPTGMGLFIVTVWAMALQLPLRHTVGHNHTDFRAVFALLLAFFWGGLTNSMPVLLWCGIIFLSCFLLRLGVLRRWMKGVVIHSRYNGYPWLGTLTGRRVHEIKVKMFLEPLVVAAVGLFVAPFGDSSFLFFVGGAVCMVVSTLILAMHERRRLDDLNDAAIEGVSVSSRFRKRR